MPLGTTYPARRVHEREGERGEPTAWFDQNTRRVLSLRRPCLRCWGLRGLQKHQQYSILQPRENFLLMAE